MASFLVLNPLWVARISILALGALGLALTWAEIAPLFLLIFLAFSTSYAFYGFFFQYNLPTWLIMISILVIFGYIFTYTEQKTGILGNKRLIYLILFSLVVLEVFLVLSYFMINPLSQSLIIAATAYLFAGFCFSILAKRDDTSLKTYLWVAISAISAILLTSSWSY
ncbi:MAG: hypothetical protein WCT32_01460 [Patescibacteria group bacterium]